MPAANDIVDLIGAFLVRAKKPAAAALAPETELYSEGLGLTSLDAAELSAVLEDEFGSDPFSAGEVPGTVGDILAFYA